MDKLKEIYKAMNFEWDDGLVLQNGPGHTMEVSKLLNVHAGRTTAIAYAAGKYTGAIEDEEGERILSEIRKLQVDDPGNPFDGCFRWYREESRPNDTNAAFFILEPLADLLLFSPESVSKAERKTMTAMLDKSALWFMKECGQPILFYTNKIVSDGAMLAAAGRLTENKGYLDSARRFSEIWLDYTESRGYGWGENLSLGYNAVILRGFNILIKSLDTVVDSDLIERFRKQEKTILDIFRFHNGHEFVPTIRSYNIKGKTRIWSYVYNLAGVRGFGLYDSHDSPFVTGDVERSSRLIVDTMIFKNRLYSADRSIGSSFDVPEYPRIGRFRIMDDRYSYTWLGENGGIGTINEFPVVEGSYQHKRWGLGWQCFPVSAIVYGKGVSFLRFRVDDGTSIRCHPHKDKHSAYLDPALFTEPYYPEVLTSCFQKENTAVVFRNINRLRNRAGMISDSYDVPGFDGKVTEILNDGRTWTVLSYESASIILTPLIGNRVFKEECSEESPDTSMASMNNIRIVSDEDGLSLVQSLYEGPLEMLYYDRLSAGWVISFIDGFLDKEGILGYISKMKVIEKCIPDGQIPRTTEWNVHEVKVTYDGLDVIETRYNPYG